MAFHVTDRMGRMHRDPDIDVMDATLAELSAPDDGEHDDVCLTHESGWCLTAFSSGVLIWEHLDVGSPRHLTGVDAPAVRRLWLSLARGDIETVDAEAWMPGYG
jgi:hypothetical protein